jgi:hypothetical protein
VQVGGDNDAQQSACIDIDMRVDAALADQAEIAQPLQKRSTDLRAFPDEHQCLAIVQPLSELVDILYVIVEDRYVVAEQLVEAVQRAERVEVVVQDRNPHATYLHGAVLLLTGPR